jgi:hypothetical protein
MADEREKKVSANKFNRNRNTKKIPFIFICFFHLKSSKNINILGNTKFLLDFFLIFYSSITLFFLKTQRNTETAKKNKFFFEIIIILYSDKKRQQQMKREREKKNRKTMSRVNN